MLKILRLYYNYFLVKWVFRKVLPAYFVSRIEVADCGEELVQYQGFWVRKRVAAESGHTTGGAVDVTLFYCGKEVDCGSRYLTFTPQTPTWSNTLSHSQQHNRFILYNAMPQAGFVNYPLGWWHFCYGDKIYAAYKFEK